MTINGPSVVPRFFFEELSRLGYVEGQKPRSGNATLEKGAPKRYAELARDGRQHASRLDFGGGRSVYR